MAGRAMPASAPGQATTPASTSGGKPPPPSPRSLHERLGVQVSANTLLDRVRGVKGQQLDCTASAAESTRLPVKQDRLDPDGRQAQPVSPAAIPLEARIAQDITAWPARGQEAPYRSTLLSHEEPSAGPVHFSQSKAFSRENNRHSDSSNSSARLQPYQAPSASASEYEGHIRVSEDGEVWRSPPQRPLADNLATALAEPSTAGSTGFPRLHTRSAAEFSMSLPQPIDPTGPSHTKEQERPGFSPLPPFARASSGSGPSQNTGPHRGVPARGFRRNSYNREASKPPSVASTSSRSHRPDARRSPPSRRVSHPYPSTQNYQEQQYSMGQAPYTGNDRSRLGSYDTRGRRDPSDSFGRSSWESYRSPPILASPASVSHASSHFIGEEIPVNRSAPNPSYSHETSTHSLVPDRRNSDGPPSMSEQVSSSDKASTSSISQAANRAHPSISVPSQASVVDSQPDRPRTIVKSEPRSAASGPPTPSASASAISAGTGKFSSSAPRIAQDSRPLEKRTVSKPSVKRAPGSPQRPSSIAIPSQPAASKPLFNSLTHSPEERKPVIRHGFTPPPRPKSTNHPNRAHNTDSIEASQTEMSGKASSSSKGAIQLVAEHTLSPARAPLPPQATRREVSHPALAPVSRQDHTIGSGFTRSQVPSVSTHAASQPDRGEISGGFWEGDMDIDELDSSSPVEATAGPSSSVAGAPTGPSITNARVPSLPSHVRPNNLPSTISTPLVKSSKGKERAVDLESASSAPHNVPPARSILAQVIDLASDDDEMVESVKPILTVQASTSQISASVPRTPSDIALPALPSPSIPPRPAPGEERTRVFPLPPKVIASVQAGGNRPRAALRNFLDDRYEELEIELQSPLRRIEEIPRDNTMRLIYKELELGPNEIAIPLPQECLRSKGPASEDREQRRSAFTIQQVVAFAKEGKEAETTRSTPAYLIVVFKSDQQLSVSGPLEQVTVQRITSTANQRQEPTGQPGQLSSVPSSSREAASGSASVKAPQSDLQKQKDKKRKRFSKEGLTDDTASISSMGSTTDSTRKKDKGLTAKQARKSLNHEPNIGSSSALPPKLPSFGGPITAPVSQNQGKTAVTHQPNAGGSTSAETRLVLGKPTYQCVPHPMHGSLSSKLKECREKPRQFFQSETFKKGYIAVSMRGHLHYWRSGRDKVSVISEDTHTHPALSVQAALWSDEHRLAILGYISTSAAAGANVQIVNMYGSKVTQKSRRTFSPPSWLKDKTGLSALAWDPSPGNGLRLAGTEQTDRRLRLWLVDPGNSTTDARLTSLVDITTRHTNCIRSILWQPESNLIYSAGADKRVCTIDPRTSKTVDEWKENLPVNRIYRRDANLVVLCLAGNRDQFRCFDLRTPRSVTAINFGQQTKGGESLGQYAHGDVMNDYFAYPVDDNLHIWDLRSSTRHVTAISNTSGVYQPHYETSTRLALLEKKNFSTLTF